MSTPTPSPSGTSRAVRTRVAAALALLALAVGIAAGSWWIRTSPREVAERYVAATGGDLAVLSATTTPAADRSSASALLRSVYGVHRHGRVEVLDVAPVRRDVAGVGSVIVSGTADGVPFTTGVTLSTDPFDARVLGEFDPATPAPG